MKQVCITLTAVILLTTMTTAQDLPSAETLNSGVFLDALKSLPAELDNIDEIIDNMMLVSANLKSASKEIRRNPWRLLHKPTDEELDSQNVYDATGAFLSGATELDQAITKLSKLAGMKPEGIPADDPQLQEIRLKLQQTFEKFGRIEQLLWEKLDE